MEIYIFRLLICGFHKRRGISCIAEELFAFQEGLNSMKLAGPDDQSRASEEVFRIW